MKDSSLFPAPPRVFASWCARCGRFILADSSKDRALATSCPVCPSWTADGRKIRDRIRAAKYVLAPRTRTKKRKR